MEAPLLQPADWEVHLQPISVCYGRFFSGSRCPESSKVGVPNKFVTFSGFAAPNKLTVAKYFVVLLAAATNEYTSTRTHAQILYYIIYRDIDRYANILSHV